MNKQFLISFILLISSVTIHAQSYDNILKIAFNDSPAYFYINTKIPFNDSPAPQIHVTGYNYGYSNKAIKLTIGWYVYNNRFYWTQYKSDLGYYNPSRIRLGTYDDAGTLRIRIEIANDNLYWNSYFISATDRYEVAANYQGWTSNTGLMPVSTNNIIEVSEYNGIVYSRADNVGIGTTAPDEKLTVKGKIHTQEVRVDMAGPLVPDYVFAPGYDLKPLSEVAQYIKENRHLPEIPSAKEIEANGLHLAEMNMKLLKKIEELTLYVMEQDKKITAQGEKLEKLTRNQTNKKRALRTKQTKK